MCSQGGRALARILDRESSATGSARDVAASRDQQAVVRGLLKETLLRFVGYRPPGPTSHWRSHRQSEAALVSSLMTQSLRSSK